jgi:beta-alanine--pyruvate transaminase
MPFTANRQFKSAPRLMASAKGMYYTPHDGRRILDGTAGLRCVNAGHCRDEIVAAVQAQAAEMDFARRRPFRFGRRSRHPVRTR